MRYFGALILLIIIFMLLLFFDNEYSLFFSVIIIIFSYLTLFLWEFSVFDKRKKTDLMIKSQRKNLNIYNFLFSFFWILHIIFNLHGIKYKALFITLVLMSLVIDIIMFFLYKKKKPFTILIDNRELIIINRWITKRDITKTNQIEFDRISKNLKFSFDEGYKISFHIKNYKKEDIKKLLEIIIDKSVHPIFIPNNFITSN